MRHRRLGSRAMPQVHLLLLTRKVSPALREALIEAVRIRARDGSETGVAQNTDLDGLARAKVRPMRSAESWN